MNSSSRVPRFSAGRSDPTDGVCRFVRDCFACGRRLKNARNDDFLFFGRYLNIVNFQLKIYNNKKIGQSKSRNCADKNNVPNEIFGATFFAAKATA